MQQGARERIQTKPNLSMAALTSFILTFVVARAFTILNPKTIWELSGIHIHHFWYGILMLAIGGWLGISVESDRTNRIAAILFGAGGGLIIDEVGLLLTLQSESYWANFTYTFVIIFLAIASMLILINKYNKLIRKEFDQFVHTTASFYVSVFLAAVSIAFILETDNLVITIASGMLATVACIIILAYFVQRIRKKR